MEICRIGVDVSWHFLNAWSLIVTWLRLPSLAILLMLVNFATVVSIHTIFGVCLLFVSRLCTYSLDGNIAWRTRWKWNKLRRFNLLPGPRQSKPPMRSKQRYSRDPNCPTPPQLHPKRAWNERLRRNRRRTNHALVFWLQQIPWMSLSRCLWLPESSRYQNRLH